MWASPDIKTNPNHLPNSRGHGSSKYDNGSTWVDHSSGLGKATVNTVKKDKTIESNDYLELLFC